MKNCIGSVLIRIVGTIIYACISLWGVVVGIIFWLCPGNNDLDMVVKIACFIMLALSSIIIGLMYRRRFIEFIETGENHWWID